MSDIEINESLAKKVLATVDHGLSRGVGLPLLGEMCIEAAVCYAMGEDHGDSPSCVGSGPRRVKISINDNILWSNKFSRAFGMRRLAIAQLGTKNNFDSNLFIKKCSEYIFEKYLKDTDINPVEIKPRSICFVVDECYNINNRGGFVRAATAYKLYMDFFSKQLQEEKFIDNLYSYYSIERLQLLQFMLSNIVSNYNNANDALISISEDIVQVFIEMESEGSKFLYLTEPPEIDPLEPIR